MRRASYVERTEIDRYEHLNDQYDWLVVLKNDCFDRYSYLYSGIYQLLNNWKFNSALVYPPFVQKLLTRLSQRVSSTVLTLVPTHELHFDGRPVASLPMTPARLANLDMVVYAVNKLNAALVPGASSKGASSGRRWSKIPFI